MRIPSIRKKGLFEVGEYAKSILSYLENAQRSLSVHGDYTDFRWFYCNVVVASRKNTLKEYKRMRRRIRQEYFPYIENTPIDIKLTLSRRIFDQNQKKIPNHLPIHYRIVKIISRYCPFKDTCVRAGS